jgi:ribonuclease P/MRP protein subunit POP5
VKPLPPSIREKQRYLKFRIHAEEDVEFGEFVETVWDTVLGYMGSKDAGKANHWIIKNKFSESDPEGVIKVERSSVNDFRAALTLIDSFGGKNGFVEVTEISGSIKKLQSD